MDKCYIAKIQWKSKPRKQYKTRVIQIRALPMESILIIASYQIRKEDCEPLHIANTMPAWEYAYVLVKRVMIYI